MKLLLSSILILSVLAVGVSSAYADVIIETALGSGAPGCEDTLDGCYLPKFPTVKDRLMATGIKENTPEII